MYYDEKRNKIAGEILFLCAQVVLLLITFGFIYTAFAAVKLAIAKYQLTFMAYFPVVLALVVYPAVLYKSRKMFRQGRMLRAFAWMTGMASLIIVLLYLYLSQLVQ